MKQYSFYILSFIICFNSYALRDIFQISDLNVHTSKVNKLVQGELKATKLYIEYNGNAFEASNKNEVIDANVTIHENIFKAKASILKYSTKLENDNPLIALDDLKIENAQINFGKEEMSFDIPHVKIKIDQTSVSANEFRGHCDPQGDSSTDIDIVCMKNGEVNSKVVHFINESLNMKAANFSTTISPASIELNSDKAVFTSDGQLTQVNIFKAYCNNGISKRFNQLELLEGCFEKSFIYLDGFSEFKNTKQRVNPHSKDDKALIDLEDIKNLRVEIENSNVSIRAKIKIIFHFNLKVRGLIEYIVAEDLIKLDIKKATFAGIPAKSLTLMLLKLFLEEDSIRIEGDTIFIAM
ncbi:hypothetical protein [Halobacteriovorax sp. HLS]|uniref:hypothetical protein n=1 Tax=Halobacteriovorax sp. HLS TaxID=2234000 RepID=UPI000FD8E60D|nr:hypothetical protein [Halobacteriovorax sp. HLS]